MRPQPYLIAEMACSHDGDPALARVIADAAIAARAQALQLQIWQVDQLVTPNHSSRPVLEEIELTRDSWRSLAGYVREQAQQAELELDLIACVYEVPTVSFCEEIGVDAYKIHAGDLTNPVLLRAVGRTGKRVDLSVGASSLDEIVQGLQWLRDEGCDDIWLMYGYQSFPTPVDDINLAWLQTLQEVFGLPLGYQDHTDAEQPGAFWLPAQAYGMGIDIFEKHVTHDRAKKGIDHQAALNPDEFVVFAEMLRTLHSAYGSGVPRPFSKGEQDYRRKARKTLVYSRELSAGHVLGPDDLLPIRTEDPGTSPERWDHYLGLTLQRDVARWQPFEEGDCQ